MPDKTNNPFLLKTSSNGSAFLIMTCAVTLATIKNKKHLKIKVWERGAGLTKACGTAACASVVSGSVLNHNDRCVDVEFKEGILNIDWKNDNNI